MCVFCFSQNDIRANEGITNAYKFRKLILSLKNIFFIGAGKALYPIIRVFYSENSIFQDVGQNFCTGYFFYTIFLNHFLRLLDSKVTLSPSKWSTIIFGVWKDI